MDLSVLYLKGTQIEISYYLYISVPEDCFLLKQIAQSPIIMRHFIWVFTIVKVHVHVPVSLW